jgi:exonuclease III
MRLHIVSFNVRRLNNQSKVYKMRNYIKQMQPSCDILMLQEHKLCGSAAHELG